MSLFGLCTWCATVLEAVVAAVAEGMFEYTLDVVKLDPDGQKANFKKTKQQQQRQSKHIFVYKKTLLLCYPKIAF